MKTQHQMTSERNCRGGWISLEILQTKSNASIKPRECQEDMSPHLNPTVSLLALDALLIIWILMIREVRKNRRASAVIIQINAGMWSDPRGTISMSAWPCVWVRWHLIASLVAKETVE